MVISISTEKAFDNIQHFDTIRALNKLGIEGIFLNLIKDICEKPMAIPILNNEILNAVPLKSRTDKDITLDTYI